MKTNHPQPPDWLSDSAKEIFLATFDQLGSAALPSDCSVIADFAQASADVSDLIKQVRFEGDTLISDKGNRYINPTMNLLVSRRKDVERLRDDIGMTPKSRGVKVTGTGKSKLDEAMRR